jgi:hypothetical protein
MCTQRAVASIESSPDFGNQPSTPKPQALEALTTAVLQTERRKAAFGRGRQPEAYSGLGGGGGGKADMPAMVKVGVAGWFWFVVWLVGRSVGWLFDDTKGLRFSSER